MPEPRLPSNPTISVTRISKTQHEQIARPSSECARQNATKITPQGPFPLLGPKANRRRKGTNYIGAQSWNSTHFDSESFGVLQYGVGLNPYVLCKSIVGYVKI